MDPFCGLENQDFESWHTSSAMLIHVSLRDLAIGIVNPCLPNPASSLRVQPTGLQDSRHYCQNMTSRE